MLDQFYEKNRQIFLASSLYDAIEDNNINAIQVLLEEKEANPNIVLPDKGIAPFHLVVGNSNEKYAEDITKLFLQHNGDPNIRSDDNMTPVHVSAAWGRFNVLKLLVNNGGDVNLIDYEGNTPLDYAKLEEYLNIVSFLEDFIDNDINETQQNKYNLTLAKLIINTGNIVAEYDIKYTDNNHLKLLPQTETNSYVENWCNKYTNKTSEKSAQLKNINEAFIIDKRAQELNKKHLHFDDKYITRRKKKRYFNKSDISEFTGDTSIHFKTIQNDLTEENINNIQNNDNSIKIIDTNKENNKKYIFKEDVEINSGLEEVRLSSDISVRNDSELYIINKTPSNLSAINKEETLLMTTDESIVYNERESGFKTLSNYTVSFDNSLNLLHKSQYIGIVESNRSTETSKYETCDEMESLICHEKNILDSIITVDDSDISRLHTTHIIENNFDHITGVSCQISGCIESEDSFLSIAEEYKYTDNEDGVVLIERRYLVTPQIDLDDRKSITSSSTIASSLPTTIDYDTDTLRRELIYRGEQSGPITATTKRLYLRQLIRLQKNQTEYILTPSDSNRVYSIELEKTIRNSNWNDDLTQYKELETIMTEQFNNPNPSKKWREGASKTSFTYLLLDPRITQNLPVRSEKITTEETWKIFLSSIFYVGKGKRSRPYAHLYDAFTHWEKKVTKVTNKKIQYILDIWNDAKGVVCLHIFQNVIPVEAYTREAAIISALKLQNLKNVQIGNFYGISETWPQKQKRLLGVYLLYRAMLIFLNEGERQLRPNDI